MRIVVTGSNGQLGRTLCRYGAEHGFDLVGLDHSDLDITNIHQVESTLEKLDASLVINAAAYTLVDQAESRPDIAFAVNGDGPGNLAVHCANAGISLLHISTDYVFDGMKKGRYMESDTVAPLGVYGLSKKAGEDNIRTNLDKHVILRTSWLYGVYGSNFVKTIIRLGLEQETIRVVADQWGSPTSAVDLAEACFTIAGVIDKKNDNAWGTYHFCNDGIISRYDFAEEIISQAGRFLSLKVKNIMPVNTDEYPAQARRPVNSALDCSVIAGKFGICLKDWKLSLHNMIRELTSVSTGKFQYQV